MLAHLVELRPVLYLFSQHIEVVEWNQVKAILRQIHASSELLFFLGIADILSVLFVLVFGTYSFDGAYPGDVSSSRACCRRMLETGLVH